MCHNFIVHLKNLKAVLGVYVAINTIIAVTEADAPIKKL